jgi:type 1 glutamine amidotransferase
MQRVLLATIGLMLLGSLAAAAGDGAQPAVRAPRILVFTKTTGFRHDSIPAAVGAVRQLGAQSGLTVDATEDAQKFTSANLARYKAVVFLLTSGVVLDAGQRTALQRFVRRGGGFVGVHSAADTEYDWAWYGQLLGTRFSSHPQIQRATTVVADRRHPSTVGLPRTWIRTDEWYNFAANPRPTVRVLATLDETTYVPGRGAMGSDHPIAWSHAFQGGRAWYTGGGHSSESYAEPLFRKHLLGGIRYAAGLTPPAIVATRAALRSTSLSVQAHFRGCTPCTGALRTVVRGRTRTSRLRFDAQVARARTGRLPRGRWVYTITIEDPLTGLRDVVRRSVTVG